MDKEKLLDDAISLRCDGAIWKDVEDALGCTHQHIFEIAKQVGRRKDLSESANIGKKKKVDRFVGGTFGGKKVVSVKSYNLSNVSDSILRVKCLECGAESAVILSTLTNTKSKKCGKCPRKTLNSIYGYWEVVGIDATVQKGKQPRIMVKCLLCDHVYSRQKSSITNGKTVMCQKCHFKRIRQ